MDIKKEESNKPTKEDMYDKIDQWICFIDDSNKEAVKMAESKNVILKKARKELDYLTGDAAVRRMAELREKWEMDEIAVKKHAERIGKEEGRREGKIEGRIEGKIEGKIEEKRAVAKKLLEIGVEISKIIEATGLNKEEIENLKQ